MIFACGPVGVVLAGVGAPADDGAFWYGVRSNCNVILPALNSIAHATRGIDQPDRTEPEQQHLVRASRGLAVLRYGPADFGRSGCVLFPRGDRGPCLRRWFHPNEIEIGVALSGCTSRSVAGFSPRAAFHLDSIARIARWRGRGARGENLLVSRLWLRLVVCPGSSVPLLFARERRASSCTAAGGPGENRRILARIPGVPRKNAKTPFVNHCLHKIKVKSVSLTLHCCREVSFQPCHNGGLAGSTFRAAFL